MNPTRFDQNSNQNNTNSSNLVLLKEFLNFKNIKGITVNSINSSNVVYPLFNSEYTQFDINLTLFLNLSVDLKVSYPRLMIENKFEEASNLRITINNPNTKHELKSCTNYLQRKKRLDLTLMVLKKCAMALMDRNLILDMLICHSEGNIVTTAREDDGVLILCKDARTDSKLFELSWRIYFDCNNQEVLDVIEFLVTKQDRVFYHSTLAALNNLVHPNLKYNIKVENWWTIIEAINTSVEGQMNRDADGPRDFLQVRSTQEINLIDSEEFESIDLEDENCIVID